MERLKPDADREIFAKEPIDRLWSELWPLLDKHYSEVAHYRDIPLAPDKAGYLAAWSAGFLRCFTVRKGGQLLGYCAFFVKTNAHYVSSLQAVQDVLFLDPTIRGGRVALRFIRWTEQQLRAEGVQVVYQHLKVATPRTVAFFGAMGYEPIDTLMAKRLDDGVSERSNHPVLRRRRHQRGGGADGQAAQVGLADYPDDQGA